MRKTMLSALLTLVLPALALPGSALAGPPQGVSGRMVLDKVADGLRKYRVQKDRLRRAWSLLKLAPLDDPRVAIALGEAMDDPDDWFAGFAAMLLLEYHCRETPCLGLWQTIRPWWSKNEPYLRRRARELPW